MKKIAMDCRMLGSGGIGAYTSELIPLFLRDSKCLLIGRMKDLEKYKENENAEILECDIKPFSLKELLSFPKDMAKRINACDAYYSTYCNIPSGIRIPIYTTIHDVVFLDVPGLASKAGTLARKWFYQHAVNRSEKVFTVSQFSKERILANLKCRKPLVIAHTAIQTWLLDQTGNSGEKDDSILFVGNIKKHKGLATLLESYESLLSENFGCKLVIVGNSENFRTGDSSTAEKIRSMPGEKITFTGRISDEELKKYYQRAKVFVQPSLYEGFGMPPLEALTCGTNVVISDIPVFREIYAPYPALFFKPEDPKDLAEKIKAAFMLPAPEKIEQHYTFEKSYEKIMEAMEK